MAFHVQNSLWLCGNFNARRLSPPSLHPRSARLRENAPFRFFPLSLSVLCPLPLCLAAARREIFAPLFPLGGHGKLCARISFGERTHDDGFRRRRCITGPDKRCPPVPCPAFAGQGPEIASALRLLGPGFRSFRGKMPNFLDGGYRKDTPRGGRSLRPKNFASDIAMS